MNKKSKIIVAIVITILLIILMIIGYTPSDNETRNDEIAKIDIQIDNSKLNIFYFYVGQADSTLIMNEGQVMLIDVGEKTDGEMITKFLKKMGIEKIDYLIGTHSDDDHIGGMANVEEKLIENLEEVDVLTVSHHASNSSTSEEFLNIISPKTAIISSGSTYSKFPNIECLKRLVKKVGTDNICITERDGTIWITSDGIADDIIQKLDKLNLDGAKSTINPNELDIDYLESILVSMFSFLSQKY